MLNQILESDKILKVFPELGPIFDIKVPEGTCKPCVRNAYERKTNAAFKQILRQTGITIADLNKYFDNNYAKVKVTKKGIVSFTNSLLKRAVATASGSEVLISDKDYLKRLAVCRSCEFMKEGICTICTCPIHEKAKRITDSCDKDYWPKLK